MSNADYEQCTSPGCTSPAIIGERANDDTSCSECQEVMLCSDHMAGHSCKMVASSGQDERANQRVSAWFQTLTSFLPSIKAAAAELRPGHTVEADMPSLNGDLRIVDSNGVELQGACNVHLPLEWDDGARWLARIRIPWPKWAVAPLENSSLEADVETEYASLQAARRVLGSLVHDVWQPLQPIGDLHLVFVERVDGHVEPGPGTYFGTVDLGPPRRYTPSAASHAVLASFPKIVERIASVPFEAIGIFWPTDNGPMLGGLNERGGEQFKTFADYLTHRIRKRLTAIDDGVVQIRDHDPPLYYLSLLELLDLVNHDPDMSRPESMFLFHGDEWQFMFDAARARVVSIIDWECARTMPLPIVMEAPWMWMWGDHATPWRGSPSNNFNALEKDMLSALRSTGNESLEAAFMKRRKYSRAWRTHHPVDFLDAEVLWLRREAFLGEDAGPKPMVDGEWDDDTWIDVAHKRYITDPGYLAFVLRLEAEYAAERATLSEAETTDSTAA